MINVHAHCEGLGCRAPARAISSSLLGRRQHRLKPYPYRPQADNGDVLLTSVLRDGTAYVNVVLTCQRPTADVQWLSSSGWSTVVTVSDELGLYNGLALSGGTPSGGTSLVKNTSGSAVPYGPGHVVITINVSCSGLGLSAR
jgi:hypothetical protein